MPEYKPLGLLQTRTYPGYQFYATMKYDGQPPEKCMKFIILTYMEWLRQKIGGSHLPDELMTPPAKSFAGVSDDQLKSYHFSGGFALDITSLPGSGIWAARIMEPELERQDKRAVIGRSFVTEIGLRCLSDCVECGVRIDILDPIDVTDEVKHAYRPAFLRKLFAANRLRIRQVEPLRYNRPTVIANTKALQRLMRLIHSEAGLMPVIVLTHTAYQRSVKELVERLDARLGLTDQPGSFLERLNQLDLVPETLELGDAILPYDADYMAYHTFGYARVYVIAENMFDAFRKRLGSTGFHPGDMLWIEPACFGGTRKVVAYDPQATAGALEYRRNQIVDEAHCYSKHKSFDFGTVIFESGARRLEVEERIRVRLQELRTIDEANTEKKVEEIYQETQELLALYEDEKKENDAECERLRKELTKAQGKLAAMEARYDRDSAKDGSARSIAIISPDMEEFYEDELHDLVVSILMDAKRSYCSAGSRAEELLDGILKVNELSGIGSELFERLKIILFWNNNITESDVSDLRELGFEVSRYSSNHYRVSYHGNPKYTYTLPSTASDVRSMKNSFAAIARVMSVYK